MLGELWSYAEFARSSIRAAEVDAFEWAPGVWFPRGEPLAALRAALPSWFPRVSEIITLVGSHNLLAAPTASQLADPRLAPFIERYLHGADGVSATDRARIFRLAWDFVGSALAARTVLYERFYLASGARNYQVIHKIAPKDRATALVDRFLHEDLDADDAASAPVPIAPDAAATVGLSCEERAARAGTGARAGVTR
jgi:aromatic ring hydroxylase